MQDTQFKTVLIMGNGFDLNLGLKTSYSDFVKSTFFDSLLVSGNKLAEYLNAQKDLNNWIDIENELKEYSKTNPITEEFFFEFEELKKSLVSYLSDLDFENIKKNSFAYRLIEEISKNSVLIIDYNYTPTLMNILNNMQDYFKKINKEIRHVKLHGSINMENIIFGVEDSVRLPKGHIFLKKSVNENFDGTDYGQQMEGCENFIVFGHSLGETDHSYFKDFFMKATTHSYRKWHNFLFFHYGKQSYLDLFSQIDSLTNNRISVLKQLNNVVTTDVKEMDEKFPNIRIDLSR